MNNLFFGAVDVRKYAALRILVGTILCLVSIRLMPFAREYYSSESWFAPFSFETPSWSLFSYVESPPAATGLLALMALCSLCFALGFFTEIAGPVLLLLLISAINRNPIVQAGEHAYRTILFCLLFSPCGRAWALDSRLRGRHKSEAPAWPLRMVQFQIAVMYFFSGSSKMLSPEWRGGSAIELVLANPKTALWPMEFPASLAPVLHVATWSLVLFECAFALLISLRWTRPYTALAGLALHIVLALTLRLEYFGIFMVGLYVCYLPDRYFAGLGRAHAA